MGVTIWTLLVLLNFLSCDNLFSRLLRTETLLWRKTFRSVLRRACWGSFSLKARIDLDLPILPEFLAELETSGLRKPRAIVPSFALKYIGCDLMTLL